MGNRAYVVFKAYADADAHSAIYLHWNGGPESVYRFLEYLTKVARPSDGDYASARFVQIMGNYLGGNTSLGLGAVLDAKIGELSEVGANGVYVVEWSDKTKCYDVTQRWLDKDKPMTKPAMAKEKKEALNKGGEYANMQFVLPLKNHLHFRNEEEKEDYAKNKDISDEKWKEVAAITMPQLLASPIF